MLYNPIFFYLGLREGLLDGDAAAFQCLFRLRTGWCEEAYYVRGLLAEEDAI